MAGSWNLPFKDVVSEGHLRTVDELKVMPLLESGKDEPMIFTCGSGVTACISALAAEVSGHTRIAIYDGSWSEWGLPDGPEVSTLDLKPGP